MSQFDTLFKKTETGNSVPSAVATKSRTRSAKTVGQPVAKLPVSFDTPTAQNLDAASETKFNSTSENKKRGKSDDASYRQVLTYLKIDTHKAVKAELIFDDQNRDLSDLVEELLAGWLARNRNGK